MRQQTLLFALVLMLLLAACSEQSSNSNSSNAVGTPELTAAAYVSPTANDDVADAIVDGDRKIGWSNEEVGFTMKGDLSEEGHLVLTSINWSNKEWSGIDWRNSVLRDPFVYMNDLNEDGADELIVITVLDHGSGFVVTEPHVLSLASASFEEAMIEPLEEIVVDDVTFEYKDNKNYIVLDGEVLFEDESEGREIEAKFEDWVYYTVSDGKLIGSVQVGDGTSSGIRGYINVVYQYINGRFQRELIEFMVSNPEGAAPISLSSTTE